jgi:ABC-type polysaccharide/polyol phosphate transport system ATPase subunit
MTTLQLHAELLRQLSYIADDETYLRKALNTIKRLVAEKKESVGMVSEKPHSEYLSDIQEMCDNVKLIKAGKLNGRPVESLLDEL